MTSNRTRLLLSFSGLLLAGTALPPGAAPLQDTRVETAALEEDCGSDTVLDVIAICNDVHVSGLEVEARVGESLSALRGGLQDAREQELGMQINSLLLEREAQRRGQTTLELLQDEVISKVTVPTDAEVRAFYESNRERMTGGYQANKPQIRAHLGQEREGAAAKTFADQLRAAADVRVFLDRVDTRQVALDRATPLATVDGVAITLATIDKQLLPLVPYVEDEIYRLRKEAVESIIEGLLLAQEAVQRGISTQDLLEAEVVPLLQPITEEAGLAFYEENRDLMDADFHDPEGRLRILAHMQRAEAARARASYTESLRQAADVQVFLVSPRNADALLVGDREPDLGPADAPVAIVLFLDYECTKCAEVHLILHDLSAEFQGQVKVLTRNFPITAHVHSHTAALAAEAAREQGRYWEFAALLLQNQNALGAPDLKRYAGQLGLDQALFDDALDNHKAEALIAEDRGDGLSLGVYSTPTVFVDGRKAEDKTSAGLRRSIAEALADHPTHEDPPRRQAARGGE